MRSPITLLKDAITLFKGNPKLYMGIYLVPLVVTLLMIFVVKDPETSVMSGMDWLVFLTFVVIMMVVNVFMGIAMVNAVHDSTLTVKGAYTKAKKHFWSYIGLGFLISVAVMVGFILLIIPGIIFAVWLSMAYFVLIVENKGITDSMKQSKDYVTGHWWAVFGRMLFLVLASFIVGIVAGIVVGILSFFLPEMIAGLIFTLLNIVLVPISVAYFYLIYRDLSNMKMGGSSVDVPNYNPETPAMQAQSADPGMTQQSGQM